MDLKFNTTGFFLKFTEINCNILRLFGHFAFYGNVKRLRVRQSIYTLYIIHYTCKICKICLGDNNNNYTAPAAFLCHRRFIE